MDLGVFMRVLLRYRGLVLVGIATAIFLSVLSYYHVSFRHGWQLTLKPRAQEVWQADSTILLTQHGFPAGRVNGGSTIGQFIGLAPLYARFANSDAVKQRVRPTARAVNGSYTAIPAADTTYGSVSGLPAIQILGRADTGAGALQITRKATQAFLTFLQQQQVGAGIEPRARVDTQLINAPSDLTLLVPRKKTLPFVVFLGVLFATIAAAFVLDNANRRKSATVVREAEAGVDLPVTDLGRSA